MKRILIVLCMLWSLSTMAQNPVRETSPQSFTNLIQRLMAGKNFNPPVRTAIPTLRPSQLMGGVDTLGSTVYCTTDTSFYIYAGGDAWYRVPTAHWALRTFYTKLQTDSITASLKPDTVLLATRAQNQKSNDSLGALINQRVQYGDTAAMLAPYTRLQVFLDSVLALRTEIANKVVIFTQNQTINAGSSARIGKYTNGQTIPAAGKTLDEWLFDVVTQAIAPTYTAPTVGVNGSPAPGNYEIGTNLGTITLSRSFNQADGGAATGDTYAKFISTWNNLGSNTDVISSLETQVYYRVTTSYAQGPCKTNNIGQIDCTGRINAGSTTSGNILYNPFYKRYWGFTNSNSPSNSEVLALSQDNNGTSSVLTSLSITPSGAQHFVFLTRGTVSSIVVNGFPSNDAFDITTRNVTNAQGFTASYTFVVSKNPLTGTIVISTN